MAESDSVGLIKELFSGIIYLPKEHKPPTGLFRIRPIKPPKPYKKPSYRGDLVKKNCGNKDKRFLGWNHFKDHFCLLYPANCFFF